MDSAVKPWEHDDLQWKRIANTISFFRRHGYVYRDVPWFVPHEINMATCPDERFLVTTNLGELVGSSEQSFLYLDSIGELGTGKFITCTPCFRNEDVVDHLHQPSFMKVEIYVNDFNRDTLTTVVDTARLNFYHHMNEVLGTMQSTPKIVQTEDGYDIEINGIEVGSYGERSWRNIRWICGTALAEPRFIRATLAQIVPKP